MQGTWSRLGKKAYMREYMLRYWREHPKAYAKMKKAVVENNRRRMLTDPVYRTKRKEEGRLCMIKYRKTHQEEIKAYRRTYRKKNRAKIRAYDRKWEAKERKA
jgi:hypothetical protein